MNIMHIDQTTLECSASNVNHGNVYLNMANSNFKDFYGLLYPDFVRIVISDDRFDSSATSTAFPTIILLLSCLPSSLTFLLKSASWLQWVCFETIR